MSAMLIVDWFPLGRDTYFRKFELYPVTFQQEVNANSLVASAPYGGSIAITRNPKKFEKVHGSSKPTISLYSASGKLTAKIQWSSGHLVLLGWSHKEELLCVQDDGMVLIYDMFGCYQHTFSMGNEVKETKVVEARFFPTETGTGVAVLTMANRIFLVNNVAEPKVRGFPELPKSGGPISCWCVTWHERESQVIVSTQEGIYVMHHTDHSASLLPFNAFFDNKVNYITAMAVSRNSQCIALYTDSGYLYFGNITLSGEHQECFVNRVEPPTEMAWCGKDAVVCAWNSTITIVGPTGEMVSFSYDSPAHLIPEIDGIRILSNTHDMIQKVPNVVQRIFRINSTDAASYLLEASKQYEKKSHRADSYIDLVKNQLDSAVYSCINAASHEFDFKTQKLLMRAAKFGKGFSEIINPDSYVKMCRTLRVLNAVRHPAIGIPLTYTQLQVLTPKVLLDRLVARRHYYLGIQIARYLQLPEIDGESRILAQWACYKVKQTQLDKEQIAEEIADKLGYAPGVSYSEIAITAADCGRKQLAIKLIDYEPRAQLQVPLLLRLDGERAALHKAVESGNTDLVYTVIFHLKENKSLADFQMSIMHCPLAMALYIKYCQCHNRDTLHDIYSQYDDFHSQALWFIKESYLPKNSMARDVLLQSAQENFKLARNDSKALLTEDQIKLLRYQRSLEETLHESVVGKPLHDTVKLLLLQDKLKLADKLRSEYKIPDRRYWWLRIQCLGENDLWTELEKFSKSKKSPIGYEPFMDECLKRGKEIEAKKYLPKIREELKIKYFLKLRMLKEAAQTAVEQKDATALSIVQAHCGPSDRQLADTINTMMAGLRHGK
ncbi:vacuolar protein sorting-associated protein 16 homolog [Orussus abietinus]|uniref:vacuolar protein sorting-associated protein 16 homolog n=1 Tax=Orussus abietinus TaxID=222816 RepID=UPI00062686AF|nr:vacuolar protein sorting-associated protein 16 homolog [Orussus abietinus]